MTDKQKSFIEHYILDYNGTQAAIRAGYSAKYAGQQAFQLLSDPEIQAAIRERREKLAKDTGVDVDWVTKRAQQLADRCMQVEPVLIFDGEAWVESGEYKFDSSGANKAIDTLAKIVGAYERDNEQKKDVIQINIQGDDAKLGE
jgi:phage terminase small subunit